MLQLHSEIDVRATAERVWEVLTRFDEYPEWNPFVVAASGSARQGAKLRITLAPPGRRRMSFSPTVLVARPERELRWLGRVVFKGLFDGEHSFTLEALGRDRTRVVQHERFSGILVPLMGRGLFTASQEGFDALMVALKERSESRRPRTKPSALE